MNKKHKAGLGALLIFTVYMIAKVYVMNTATTADDNIPDQILGVINTNSLVS